MTFRHFFQSTTGNLPYDYQSRLAGNDSGTPCQSQLINIPTGLGKTAAVVLGWLWNRVHLQNPEWPRRLVYCLPTRTLVEQTQFEVRKWQQNLLTKLTLLGIEGQPLEDLKWLAENSPVIVMGGEDAGAWDLYPEKPAILIGTQDMLLSRALNRGYGMSRYRWPMHFGLLNNDVLWVMDETQLMGVGVETSAQLDGFHRTWLAEGSWATWWMSATLDEARFATVDHPPPTGGWPALELSEAERSNGRPKELIEAKKAVIPCPLALSATTKADYTKNLALLVYERHQKMLQKPHPSGTLTLVVLNRVSRAREVYSALAGGNKPLCDPSKVALIHSRFRRPDRQRHETLLFAQSDRIVIATQAVEAGVDVSARLLVTELAPWSSLVQRMGRCNRRADLPDAEVLWVNIQPKDDKDDLLLPYAKDELAEALEAIGKLTDASPRALREVKVAEKAVVRPVIRRRDLVDLFDTTPDLCGQDLDISRYIRDDGDSDVQLFWRAVEGDAPPESEPPPHRDELCRVPIGEASKFLGKKTKSSRGWRWNPLCEQWERVEAVRPGGVYLVDVKSGGYSEDLGWTGNPKDKPLAIPSFHGEPESYAGNRLTFDREWQTLPAHTQLVVRETELLAKGLACDAVYSTALHSAALWHDVGKAHIKFQEMLRHHDASREGTLWAKSANKGGKCSRQGFRHELASALAWLLKSPADAAERDLIAYLIAAHHGKVRLSIRPLPEEKGNPEKPDNLFARGIWDGDTLPPIPGLTTEPTSLDLSFMQMGEGRHGPSWLARAVALRDRIGPFRLALFETILRAADARASRRSAFAPTTT